MEESNNFTFNIPLSNSRFKSTKRAMRRGHLHPVFGYPIPNRPFNNRKPTPGRSENEQKKKDYEQSKRI